MIPTRRIAALILAAGGSRRMGRSKQTLLWRGVPLIRGVALEALASSASPVTVVVGCDAVSTRQALDGLDIGILEHPGWEGGMGTSIGAGVSFLAAGAEPPDAVVILLGDQPHVTASSIGRLIEAHRATGLPLIGCRYGEGLGAPALFAASFFPELAALRGDHGAREVFVENAAVSAGVDLPEALTDVDTPADYEGLR
ncbi:MAG: nucleotidyltransferase family protein [Acidobacteriota bacterium]